MMAGVPQCRELTMNDPLFDEMSFADANEMSGAVTPAQPGERGHSPTRFSE